MEKDIKNIEEIEEVQGGTNNVGALLRGRVAGAIEAEVLQAESANAKAKLDAATDPWS